MLPVRRTAASISAKRLWRIYRHFLICIITRGWGTRRLFIMNPLLLITNYLPVQAYGCQKYGAFGGIRNYRNVRFLGHSETSFLSSCAIWLTNLLSWMPITADDSLTNSHAQVAEIFNNHNLPIISAIGPSYSPNPTLLSRNPPQILKSFKVSPALMLEVS